MTSKKVNQKYQDVGQEEGEGADNNHYQAQPGVTAQ